MAGFFGSSSKGPGFPQTSDSYLCKQYNQPAPAPLAAVTAPLPSERDSEKDFARKEKLAAKEAAYAEKKAAQAAKGGLFGKIGKVAVTAASVVEGTANKGYDAATETYLGKSDEKSLTRFRALGFPFEEKLQDDYHCCVCVGDRYATGYLAISTNFVTFDGRIDKLFTQNNEDLPVRVVLPLSSIASIRVGAAKKATEKGRPHTITLNEDMGVPGEKATADGSGVKKKFAFYDALLIYTSDGFLHEFYDFKHYQINYFDDMYNYLDHQWRAAFGTKN